MARPFYALRHLKPDAGAELKAESNDLVERTLKACRIEAASRAVSVVVLSTPSRALLAPGIADHILEVIDWRPLLMMRIEVPHTVRGCASAD